jgi:cell division protein DivIC
MKIVNSLKNKFAITAILFFIYLLFLDDTDIFTIVSNLRKQSELTEQNYAMAQNLKESRISLRRLRKIQYLEHYARSKKFFKKKDEEIFVIIPKDKGQLSRD